MASNLTSLLNSLVKADSEEVVKKIIESHSTLSNPKNWKPYGGTGSIGTFNNQQQDSVAALAEKPVNSIDALLLRECRLAGIDPESDRAPKTMQEAVEKFFGIKKGDFSDVGEKKRREIADQILIIADGSREKPNIIVADKGEGQAPDDFEKTFLSLHAGHKINIQFVQGKYHMGSTGVLPNCGMHHYQLLISRRHPKLLAKGQEDAWGFSVVRLHKAGPNDKSSWYEFSVDNDGDIMRIPPTPLKILPGDKELDFGSFIKMFNYDLKEPSIITLDLWRKLNRILFIPALPMVLEETRDYRGHSPSKVLLGNKTRILVDERDNVEPGFPITINAELGALGKRSIEIALFKEGIKKSEFGSETEAVFFTVNGQTHATIGRSFLKTRAKLGYLADYLVIHIDCSDVDTNTREDVFMASRDRMRDNNATREIQDLLASELEKHEGLKKINQFRREQHILKNPKDVKFLEDVVSNLLKNNQSLINYLLPEGRIQNPKVPGPTKIEEFEGKRFPTYFKLIAHRTGDANERKQIPINSFALIKFETDATNDYFDRETETGSLNIEPDISKSFHLWNGVLTLKVVPEDKARVGSVRSVKVALTRPYSDPLVELFEVQYSPAIKTRINENGEPPEDKSTTYKLPEPTLVYRQPQEGAKCWEDMDPTWDGEDIVGIIPSPDSVDIFINMDSDNLHMFLRRHQLTEKQQELAKRAYQTGIYLYSLILYNDLKEEDNLNLIPQIMKSISKIILDLIYNDVLAKEWESESLS